MFNIGFVELIVLAVIGLLVIGPEQLPDLARKAAKLLNDLKRTKDELLSPVDEIKTSAQIAIERMRKQMDADMLLQMEQEQKNQTNDDASAKAENLSMKEQARPSRENTIENTALGIDTADKKSDSDG